MVDKIYKSFESITKSIDPEQGIYETMISTEGIDRQGDIVRAIGARTENYLKNPVVLWAHRYDELPIAKTVDLTIIPGSGIKARYQFPDWGVNEKADTIRKLWSGGFLNATSIGFAPIERKETPTGYEFTQWELLEFSLVVIPANADALRLAIKALDETEAKSGRVLSAKNENKIREAVGMLQEVLSQLGEEEPRGFEPMVEKPYPSEHACRLRDPGDFEANSFRRVKREHEGKEYSVIMGKLKGETSMTEQAYRYPKDGWTSAQARAHCNSHDGASFEPASEEEQLTQPCSCDNDTSEAETNNDLTLNDASEARLVETLHELLLQLETYL